jgi:hypothetical protein
MLNFGIRGDNMAVAVVKLGIQYGNFWPGAVDVYILQSLLCDYEVKRGGTPWP